MFPVGGPFCLPPPDPDVIKGEPLALSFFDPPLPVIAEKRNWF
jgi:hypothetical protein